jgi:prepilin-type N-terminal cleavage/methylation domain-containing protein
MEWKPMDRLNATARRREEVVSNRATPRGRAGFTLIEALVALLILTVGLLGLAQAFYLGMRHMSTSSANLIAREKAREAVESVHTARDTGTLSWNRIKNVSNGGIFLDGAQPLCNAGVDGLVNTADDAAAGIENLREPGPNGLFGDADDVLRPFDGFTREIQILELTPVDPDLRELRVTITFQVGAQRGSYSLRTYVSAFS